MINRLSNTSNFRIAVAFLFLFVLVITNYTSAGIIYASAATTSIPTQSVIDGAKSSFLANKGAYSDWDNPSSGFKVNPDYSYRLSETSSTEYKVFGTESYNEGINVADKKKYLSNSVKACAIFEISADSKNKPGGIGFTATNLKIWNPDKKTYDYLDMKVTVTSWEISNGSDNFIYIRKDPKTTVYISDTIEAKLEFEYFYAGTQNRYMLKGNLTYADIDDYQYVGFSADKTAYQYVASNSLLNFTLNDGLYIYYRNGGPDSSGTPRLAAGISFETETLEILFGNNSAKTYGSEWAMFAQYAESMGLIAQPEPYKTVSDGDEEEKESVTLGDMNEGFVYRVSQRVPAGMSSDMYYSSFVMQDKIDSCLLIKDVKVLQDFAVDKSEWFTIENTDNNVLASALPEVLNSNQFYGGNQKNDTVLTLEISCVLNPDMAKDDFVAHGHYNTDKSALSYKNIGTVTISASPKSTNEVDVRVGVPDIIIEKRTDRYEYQVGEPIEYTIDVFHSENSFANALGVVVRDVDLPEGLVIDEATITSSGISAPSSIATTTGGIVLYADRIDLNEKCTVSFTAVPKKILNGTIVINTASVIADTMTEEKKAAASVYINSPKLNLEKVADKKKLKVGDMITYELTLTQINPGTFMRDIYIEDRFPESGVKLHKGSIQIFDSQDRVITQHCDINVSGSSIIVVPYVDMGYEDLYIPVMDASDSYETLNLESKITVTYDVSITDDYDEKLALNNIAVAPATENTNGDVIKDDMEIPSGGDEVVHTIDGKIETTKAEPKEPPKKQLAKTGDIFNPFGLALIIAISGAILVVLLVLRKKLN